MLGRNQFWMRSLVGIASGAKNRGGRIEFVKNIYPSHVVSRTLFNFDSDTLRNMAKLMNNPKVKELMDHPDTKKMVEELKNNPGYLFRVICLLCPDLIASTILEKLAAMKAQLFSKENMEKVGKIINQPSFEDQFSKVIDKTLNSDKKPN